MNDLGSDPRLNRRAQLSRHSVRIVPRRNFVKRRAHFAQNFIIARRIDRGVEILCEFVDSRYEHGALRGKRFAVLAAHAFKALVGERIKARVFKQFFPAGALPHLVVRRIEKLPQRLVAALFSQLVQKDIQVRVVRFIQFVEKIVHSART